MRYVIVLSFQFLMFLAHAQNVQLDTLAKIPEVLTEISGMENAANGAIWAINDSGNDPVVFQIDEKGKVLRSVFIANATNVDWEEMTKDDDGNIYIGDFGNNRNARQDLKVYIVKELDLQKKDTAEAQIIEFAYEDQYAFPPKVEKQNFDMEAMVYYKNRLILFSKNRTKPFTGYTNVYQLPNVPGKYVAAKIDSLNLGEGPRELYQVTGASISPDGLRVLLLSYDKFYIIHDFPYADLVGGRVEMKEFEEVSQKEAIIWKDDSTIVISDEKSVLGGGYLYQLDVASSIKENNKIRKAEVEIPVKEFKDTLLVEFETEVRGKVYYEFYSGEGDRIDFAKVGYFDRGKHSVSLVPGQFKNGMYMLNIQIGSRPHAFFVYRHNAVDWEKVKQEIEKSAIDRQNRKTTEPEK